MPAEGRESCSPPATPEDNPHAAWSSKATLACHAAVPKCNRQSYVDFRYIHVPGFTAAAAGWPQCWRQRRRRCRPHAGTPAARTPTTPHPAQPAANHQPAFLLCSSLQPSGAKKSAHRLHASGLAVVVAQRVGHHRMGGLAGRHRRRDVTTSARCGTHTSGFHKPAQRSLALSWIKQQKQIRARWSKSVRAGCVPTARAQRRLHRD